MKNQEKYGSQNWIILIYKHNLMKGKPFFPDILTLSHSCTFLHDKVIFAGEWEPYVIYTCEVAKVQQ